MSRYDPNIAGGGGNLPSDVARYLNRVRIGAFYGGTVTNDGGSAGDATTPCSFTYTVMDVSGKVVGKALSPEKGRLVNCTMNVGTIGVFYYDSRRTVHLWDVNETATQTNCS